jgi:hypothetical protein
MPVRAMTWAAVVLAAVAACVGSGTPSSTPTPADPSTSAPQATAPQATAPQATPIPPTVGPPVGRLAAEGGDPVSGQLGTYVWRDAGSDSPWLPGAPVTVGAGEPLTVSFDPAIGVASWRARLVPADADAPVGATLLGQGVGDPAFQAPEAGSWTVEVHVVFDAGDASYFWRLEVT